MGEIVCERVLVNKAKNRYHQEFEEQEAGFRIDGTMQEGYSFEFSDRQLGLNAKLNYTPMDEKGLLFYYNGRMAICPSMAQVFYDSFAFNVSGELEIRGKTFTLTGARGIIEHGVEFSRISIFMTGGG